MTRAVRSVVIAAALAGLTSGIEALAQDTDAGSKSPDCAIKSEAGCCHVTKKKEKHACKGQNSCKGKGGCGSTKGKNDCKGKGECRTDSKPMPKE